MKENENNCEAIYWKGKALKQSGNLEAAVVSYEQVISLNSSQSATLRSLYDLALIRIMERDIYLAYYTLERIEEIPEEIHSLFQLKLFLNGAVHMMKKKFREGIDSLSNVDFDKLKEPMIESLVKSYLAYGFFCLGDIAEALTIYQQLGKESQLIEGDTYNMYLSQGVLDGEKEEFQKAIKNFEKAKTLFRIKVEPTFYLVVFGFDLVH